MRTNFFCLNMTDQNKKKVTKWFWILITAPVVAVIGLLCLVWAFADIPSLEELENPDSKLATQVIAEEGEILTTYHIENRTFVSYDELAPSLVQAAVATEDPPLKGFLPGRRLHHHPAACQDPLPPRRARRKVEDDLDKAQGMDHCHKA